MPCISHQETIDLNQDVETISARTEDSLLSHRTDSGTVDVGNSKCCVPKQKKVSICCLITGIILTSIGILTLIWTPFTILMRERLRMLPGLPPFEWWKSPPDEVLLRIYLFNTTNSEAFLNGTDEKLNFQEIGPIIYMEKLIHTDVKFNENGTLTYVAKRNLIFLPELNTISLNETLIIPNIAVLGMASYLHDSSYFSKIVFNMMFRSVKSPIFIEATLYEYMWNFTDPILPVAQTLRPSLVPFLNIGVLERIYSDFDDEATVYVGPDHGDEKFFLMDKYHGSSYLPGYDESCRDLVVNSTEGVLYPQYLNKMSELRYWRKTLCRVIPLHYEDEFVRYSVNSYKFTMPNEAYDRYENISNDCYKGTPPMMSGLSDVSACYHGIPMAASFPHFLHGSEDLKMSVGGLKPNRTQHESFVIVEPLTGIPIEAFARSQSNLIVRQIYGFHPTVQKFSNSVLPMFWLEYNQVGLPNYIQWLMYFIVVIVPSSQTYFSALCILLGTVILYIKLRNIRKHSHFRKNTNLHFEQETFLKRCSK